MNIPRPKLTHGAGDLLEARGWAAVRLHLVVVVEGLAPVGLRGVPRGPVEVVPGGWGG